MKRLIYLIFVLIAVAACKEVFVPPPQSLLQASFLNSTSETETALTSTVTVHGIGQDSLLYDNSSVAQISLPLTSGDTIQYVISFDSSIDTVTFVHKTSQFYDSMETGFYYEYKLKSATSTHLRIDSLAISDSLVTTKWHENIKLYIRPLPSGSN
jgi:hypothetical protein